MRQPTTACRAETPCPCEPESLALGSGSTSGPCFRSPYTFWTVRARSPILVRRGPGSLIAALSGRPTSVYGRADGFRPAELHTEPDRSSGQPVDIGANPTTAGFRGWRADDLAAEQRRTHPENTLDPAYPTANPAA